jgi:hypothetical protein
MLDRNWQGVVRGLVLLGLLFGDLALLGHTAAGYVGCGVIVVVAAVVLRNNIGPRWLHG